MFVVIKWNDINQVDLVSSKIANIKHPQTVIKYYEKILYFTNHPDIRIEIED